MSATTTTLNPQRIMQLSFGFIPSVAVSTAVDLGLFSHIHAGQHTAPQLAEACKVSERGIQSLLYTLSALGLVEQRGQEFFLSADSEAFLVTSAPGYLGGVLAHQVHQLQQWARFGEAVRSGTSPLVAVEGKEDDGEFFAGFVDSLFALNWHAAQAIAERLPPARRALDIGCGSGVWSLALAQKQPELLVTAVDRAKVLQVTAYFTSRHNCTDRYTLRDGDLREVELEKDTYDVAYLGHILHSEGEEASRTLLRRMHESLKPGGILVVAEMVASQPRSQEMFPNLFDLNMLMFTEKGCVFDRSQLEQMGTEAGFARHEWVDAPSPSPILLLHKA